MPRTALVALVPLLAACNPGSAFSGTLVDGFTDQPRADVAVLAKSADTTDLTCQVRESRTDATGAFHLQNLCTGATYALSLGDETLMLDQSRTLDGSAEAAAGVKLVSWRAPSGDGVYKLTDDGLSSLRSFSDVATETILESEEVVRYPTMKPTKVVTIGNDDRLVLSGADVIARMEVHPLVADAGKRQFAGDVSIEDHVYIGVRFASDTEWEAQAATMDASKVTLVDNGDKQVKYLPGDALPQGRYAVLGSKDKRTYVFDFGAAPVANAQAE